MKEVVIVSACRTPIGRFQGTLSPLSAPKIGAIAASEAIRRAGIDAGSIEECIFGNVLTAGLGQNPARQVALAAGVSNTVGSLTINKVCGSGLKAVMLAAQAIRAGDADCVLAGGMESMTNAPYILPQARRGVRLGHGKLLDSMVQDGLWDVYNDFHMGMTGELVAKEHQVSREDQDAFAVESHRKAVDAEANGRFDAERVSVTIPKRKSDDLVFSKDEGPRADVSVEGLAKLRPVFDKAGSVTAGNASSINDGAAALVVMSADRAKESGVAPLARITHYATGGCAPEWVMMAPEKSIQGCAQKHGMGPGDFDLHEINEAFSVAAIALQRTLELDPAKINVNGGAVSLGHPIGASGARILVTLLHAMQQRDVTTGMASLCLGGGNAVSLGVERI